MDAPRLAPPFILRASIALGGAVLLATAACGPEGPDGGAPVGGATTSELAASAETSPPSHRILEGHPDLQAAHVLAWQRAAGEAYRVHAEDTEGLRARNPAQGFGVAFDGGEVHIDPRRAAWDLRLRVDGVGCEGAMEAVEASPAQVDPEQPNLVWQAHERLWAWYLNGPLGLQQGFEVTDRPACVDTARLRVRVGLEGLRPGSAGDGALVLRDEAGAHAMRVDGLYAIDADGDALPAELGIDGEAVTVDVDVAGATFPVRIDPMWSEQTRFVVPGDASSDRLGSAVSIAGDTAIVGAPLNNDTVFRAGAAFVFVRGANGMWTEQQKLFASDADERDNFGTSVAIEGDVAVVGAPGNDDAGDGSGAAYVFVRNGTTWTQEQKLLASDGAFSDEFGMAVSVSGATAVVGARGHDPGPGRTGAAYVFVRNGTAWTEEQKLVTPDASSFDDVGATVSVDGDTAVIGSHRHDSAGSNAGAAYVFVRSGTTWTLEQKLTAADPAGSDWFGFSVGLSGDTAVVGAYRDDDQGSNSGSAYVFVRNGTTWTQEQKLTASDGGSSARFGYSVAVSADTAVVGAYDHFSGGVRPGAAYVFVRSGTTWTEEQKLAASDGADNDDFGFAVAVAGDTVISGAPFDDDTAVDAGSAYAFQRNGTTWAEEAELVDPDGMIGDPVEQQRLGRAVSVSADTAVVGTNYNAGGVYVFVRSGATWVEQAKVEPSDGGFGDRFGQSVSLSGDTMLVGAPYHEVGGVALGAAYVFVRNGATWTEEQKLVPSDGIDFGEFAYSLSLSGDTALVGAYYDDDGGEGSGAAYVYVRNGTTWTLEQKLTASDGEAFDYFGYGVSLAGDIALVGAYADDDGASDAGAAYVFVRNGTTWTEEQKLTASDAEGGDLFGIAVATSETTAIVGAPNEDSAGSNAGAAYVFERSGTSWIEEQKLVGNDTVAGDRFGDAVSLAGDRVLVGAPNVDGAVTNIGAAYLFLRSGTTWAEEQKLTASDAGVSDNFGTAVSLAGGTALVGAPRADDEGADSGGAYLFVVENVGAACVDDAECGTGHCVDGVCCDTACGGGVVDCQSCLAAETGVSDGTCAPSVAGTECRAAGGACDVAEACDGVATECPADAVATSDVVCRPATDACDLEERCDGVAPTCPADGAAADGTPCDDGDACTVDDVCAAGVCSPGADSCGTGGGGQGGTGVGGGPASPLAVEDEGGCACRATGPSSEDGALRGLVGLMLLGLARLRRRRR